MQREAGARPGRDARTAFVASSSTTPRTRLPFLAMLAILVMLLPLYFFVGTLYLSPSRILFLLMVPVLFFGLISGKYGRWTYVDTLMVLYIAWRTLAVFVTAPSVAVQYAGSNTIILLGGYFTARATIRSLADFQALTRFLTYCILFSLPFVVVETITSNLILPPLFEKIPGITSIKDVNYLRRMGFDRVQFVFAHPIHYGLFCSLGISLYFVGMSNKLSGFWRWVISGLILLCCFLSVSSGPFLSALVQIFLVVWATVFRSVEKRWLMLALIGLSVYLVIEVASNRPGIYVVISMLSFAPHTANVRRILLEYGLAQVVRTPVFGIGFSSWDLPRWMSGSLDNYWLANALTFGVPAFAFLFAAMIGAMISAGRRDFRKGSDLANARLAWNITMTSIALTFGTVYVWGEMASLVFFMFGAGIWLLDAKDDDIDKDAGPATPDEGRASRYTRFNQVRSRRTIAPPGRASPRNRIGR